MRSDNYFHSIFENTKSNSPVQVNQPTIPNRKNSNNWSTPEEYYRSQHFMALDLLINKIKERFDQPTLSLLVKIESLIIDSANNKFVIDIPKEIIELYNDEIDEKKLLLQVKMLPNLVSVYNDKHPSTCIKKATKLSTIIELFLATQNMIFFLVK